MKLYLAHPLVLRKEIREIELDIEAVTGVEILNPFYDTGRDDIYEIDAGRKSREDKGLDYRAIVKKDLGHIAECDGIVSYIEKEVYSLGTLFETWDTMVRYEDKIIYIVSPDCLMPPWIRYLVDSSRSKGFSSWEDLKCELLKRKQSELGGD